MTNETRRKLTTIFSADVQDYTRMMGADEEGTLATLKQYRDKMAALIESYGGRVVNTWGDGLIAEFPSVVEAVRAAIDTQSELAGYNAARPAEARMLFRIGINLGDVIVQDDDIYGDGVNIAARLQTSAPAGGIVISNTVYDHVRNKLAVGFDFLGPLTVKNVTEGVPSYAVRIGDEAPAARSVPPVQEQPRPAAATRPASERFEAGEVFAMPLRKMIGVFTVLSIGLIVINILTWGGKFWAIWPILTFSFLSAMRWVRVQKRYNRQIAALGLTGIVLVSINLITWGGTFWAIWPLLGLSIAAGIRWFAVHR
jgi:adenylate cyclase